MKSLIYTKYKLNQRLFFIDLSIEKIIDSKKVHVKELLNFGKILFLVKCTNLALRVFLRIIDLVGI